MKHLWWLSMLVIFGCFGTVCHSAADGSATKTYQNQAFSVYWHVPATWEQRDAAENNLVVFEKKAIGATVTLKAFPITPELPISMDQLQESMVGAYYDSWEIVATRDASDRERYNSGATQQSRVLYRKRSLKWDASFDRMLVLEHYFLSPQYAYVITCRVSQEQWSKASEELQEFLEGFNVAGPVSAFAPATEAEQRLLLDHWSAPVTAGVWEGESFSSISPDRVLWVAPLEGVGPFQLAFDYQGNVLVHSATGLIVLDAQTGAQKWTLAGPMRADLPVALYRDTLVIIYSDDRLVLFQWPEATIRAVYVLPGAAVGPPLLHGAYVWVPLDDSAGVELAGFPVSPGTAQKAQYVGLADGQANPVQGRLLADFGHLYYSCIATAAHAAITAVNLNSFETTPYAELSSKQFLLPSRNVLDIGTEYLRLAQGSTGMWSLYNVKN